MTPSLNFEHSDTIHVLHQEKFYSTYPVMMAAMTRISTKLISDIQMQLLTMNRLSLLPNDAGEAM